ncbi:MAG: hypothetical protein ACW99U_22290 [Candidatus Thorarchaeota archaeon]
MSRLRSIVPTDAEIDDVLSKCFDEMENGSTKYSGMTYEEGVVAALDWAFGTSDADPMMDE